MASIIAKVLGDGKSFDKTVAGMRGSMKRLRSSFSSLGGVIGGAALGAWVKKLIDAGSAIFDVSKKLGVSSTRLQEWRILAEDAGVAATAADNALQRFSRRVGEAQKGIGVLAPEMERYNIALFDSAGKARAVSDVMDDYADRVAGAGTRQEQLRLSVQAFDIEGGALVNVLELGSEGMKKMSKDAHDLGRIIADEDVVAMKEFGTAIDNVLGQLTKWGTVGVASIKKVGVAIGEGLFGTEKEILAEGFLESAEREIRHLEEVVERLSSVSTPGTLVGGAATMKEFVQRGEELIPIQDAINERAEELREKSEAAADAYDEITSNAGELTDEQTANNTRAEELKATQKAINELVSKGNEERRAKTLPDVERLAEITQEIVDATMAANDASRPRKDREESAKRLVALQNEQLTVALKINTEEEKAQAVRDKKLAGLQKEEASLKAQLGTLEQQSAEWLKQGRFASTFEEFATGAVGFGSDQVLAQRIIDRRQRIQERAARGGSQEAQQRELRFLELEEERFRTETGVSSVDNPFTEALSETNDKLDEVVEAIDKL